MEIKGIAGTLLAGGRIAARLRDWTIEHLETGSMIRAAVESVIPFWLEHSSHFDVVLQVGSRTWRWRRIEVLIDQGRMKAQVEGNPEVRSGA